MILDGSASFFVSYSRPDKNIAEKVFLILEEKGMSYFDYQREPVDGQNVKEEIESIIWKYDGVISVFSTNAQSSNITLLTHFLLCVNSWTVSRNY